jgi:hypothetical protein
MATFFPIDTTRRHAPVSALVASLILTADYLESRATSLDATRRPRLVASWHIGPGNRPTCTWAVERPGPQPPTGLVAPSVAVAALDTFAQGVATRSRVLS